MAQDQLPLDLPNKWGREPPPRPPGLPERIASFVGRCNGSRKAIQAATRAELDWLQGRYAVATRAGVLVAYRKALRAAARPGKTHPALEFMHLTDDENRELLRQKYRRVSDNQRNLRLVDDPDEMITKARILAFNPGVVRTGKRQGLVRWQDVAAGLALLTGRRPIELLRTGEFRSLPGQTHAVEFRGRAKTRMPVAADDVWFTIPVLAPSDEVIAGMRRLRTALPDINGQDNNTVRGRFSCVLSSAVNNAYGREWTPCDLRAVYALCCYHAFAPSNISQLTYYSDIFGYRLLREDFATDKDQSTPIAADTLTASFYLRFCFPDGFKGLKL
jgi:hypothetical protein